GDDDRQPADDLVGGVDEVPALLHLALFGHVRCHRSCLARGGPVAEIVMISEGPGPSRAGPAQTAVDNLRGLIILTGEAGRSSAWLERSVRDRKVGGSNPLAPTLQQ